MKRIILITAIILTYINLAAIEYTQVIVGAERFELYLDGIRDKRVAVLGNHTSMIGETHLVDVLLEKGIAIDRIFCPEHGFRGNADAGEHLKNYIDEPTGIPVISLYGRNKKPGADDLAGIDVVLFDIQDVGVRFYTYISTMHYMMEACAENNVKLVVLDRPNPNGFYVDGPVLDIKYQSFVGMHPVPLVHGMTIGEFAKMINGEKWLKNEVKCELEVVPCDNYDHNTFYEVPIKPSPNLQTMRSIYYYPSLGLFEGTVFSAGRGTDFPFMVFGHPRYPNMGFEYTPRSIDGASKNPKFKGEKCYGMDLRSLDIDAFVAKRRINLEWIIDAYYRFPDKDDFFNNFFYKLAGNKELREKIEQGMFPEEIRKSWEKDKHKFMKVRKKYLLYTDFE